MPAQLVGRRTRLAAVLVAVAMALALVGCGGGGDDNKLGDTADIVIDKMGFQPNKLEVRVGQEVTFSVLNKDDRPHTFTLTFLDINKDIPVGQRVDIRFKADQVPPAGFYSFYSNEHQSEGYQGKIIVKR
jgi:plastocyanin